MVLIADFVISGCVARGLGPLQFGFIFLHDPLLDSLPSGRIDGVGDIGIEPRTPLGIAGNGRFGLFFAALIAIDRPQ